MAQSAASTDPDEIAGNLTAMQRFLTLATVVLASSLYGTALLTTSTMLPQMQGAMSATQDEIAWVMTFNILATAIVTPMTGWLVARFGAKRVMVWSIGTLHARDAAVRDVAVARDAGVLAHPARRRRRAGGAAVADDPARTRSRAASTPWCFGSSAWRSRSRRCSGPMLGGYLAEIASWRWAFYMLVPVGVCGADRHAARRCRRRRLPPKVRLDWTGFLALAVAIAAVQLVLARGVRLDWFESTEIIIECLVAAIAFYVFLRAQPHHERQPFLNLRLLTDRNYAIGLVLVTIYGMLNFTPMVLLPPLLQQHAASPTRWSGR